MSIPSQGQWGREGLELSSGSVRAASRPRSLCARPGCASGTAAGTLLPEGSLQPSVQCPELLTRREAQITTNGSFGEKAMHRVGRSSASWTPVLTSKLSHLSRSPVSPAKCVPGPEGPLRAKDFSNFFPRKVVSLQTVSSLPVESVSSGNLNFRKAIPFLTSGKGIL